MQRLAVLTDDEIELLIDATTTERGHLLWAAACRRYDLIGEFAEEVLRERFLLLTPTLDHDDFDSFVRGKALWHEELAELKESTLRKLRANVFRMLREAGLLSDDGHILQAVLSHRVAECARATDAERHSVLSRRVDDATGGRAMTRMELSKQEEHLFAVLSSKRFLQMEGLSNEVPFFIYPYAPEDALEVAQAKKRIKNRLANKGIEVREVNLYDLSVEILKERGVWERFLQLEPDQDKDDFRELLQGMLDPQLHIAPGDPRQDRRRHFDIFFLTGIGEVFPYIRSHNVLNNLAKRRDRQAHADVLPRPLRAVRHLGLLAGALRAAEGRPVLPSQEHLGTGSVTRCC